MRGIVYLGGSRYGGWATFNAHLAKGYMKAGIPHRLMKVGQRTHPNARDWVSKVQYTLTSLQDIFKLMRKHGPVVLSAVNPQDKALVEAACELMAKGAWLVVHDPNELKTEWLQTLKSVRPNIITIRAANVAALVSHQLESVYIGHPYSPLKLEALRAPEKYRAVCYARVDFEKHHEIIAQANESLGKNAIKIFGHIHRPFAQHTLDKKYPGWRDHYVDRWGFEDLYGGARIASTSKYVVDMSVIKGDGGGTQYTHLEAINAGKRLVLNERWLTGIEEYDEIAPAAMFVQDGSPEHLASIVSSSASGVWPELLKNGESVLKAHKASRIARQYEDVVKGS